MTTRVLLHSKDPVLCAGLKALLDQTPGFELTGMAPGLEDVVAQAQTQAFNVILLEMNPATTMNGLIELRRQLTSAPMVLWVQSIPVEIAHQLIQLGIQGILRRELAVELLLRCLQKVAQGELWYERALSEMLLRSREVSLSPRERQLVELISQGFSNRQIGEALMITEGTVKVYLSKLFKKVGVADRFELAIYTLKHLHYGSMGPAGPEQLYCPASLIRHEQSKLR
jgi:DNA-binding NarL/FixJ family response regulator